MKAFRTMLATLAVPLLVLHGVDALAQLRGGFPGGGGGFPGGGRGAARAAPQRPAPEESRVNQQEELVEELRQDLRLRPEQVPAWDYYLEKVRAMTLDIARENARSRTQASATALQRIDHSVDVARDRLTALEEIAMAARRLYAALEPEQQSIADSRLAGLVPAPGEGSPLRGAPGTRLRPASK